MRNELDISLEKRYVREEALKEGLEKGEAKGREEGREAGREEGKADALLETARKMQAMGLSSEQIKEATGVEL